MRKLVGLGMARSIPPNLNADALCLENNTTKTKPRKGKLKNKKE
jgi:hypothetical protein